MGKSSLLNQLLGESRALVTNTPGTTRDYISETIELGEYQFELIDTAGIRDTKDPIETLGIEKIKDLMKKVQVVLWIIDISRPLNKEETQILTTLPPSIKVYILLNKIDLNKFYYFLC